MSKTDVISRKDMKEPDKFQQAATQAAGWVAAGGSVTGPSPAAQARSARSSSVVVLAAVTPQREERAGAAASSCSRPCRGESLGGPAARLPGPVLPDRGGGSARSSAARSRCSPSTADGAAELAALAKGDAHPSSGVGRREGRVRALPRRRRAGRLAPLRRARGARVIAEGQGRPRRRPRAFERLAKEAPAFADRADLERARVLAAAGKTEEARQVLAAFPEKHKESPLAPEAPQRLARLGGSRCPRSRSPSRSPRRAPGVGAVLPPAPRSSSASRGSARSSPPRRSSGARGAGRRGGGPASGLALFGTRDGWLHAVRADGTVAWEFRTDGGFRDAGGRGRHGVRGLERRPCSTRSRSAPARRAGATTRRRSSGRGRRSRTARSTSRACRTRSSRSTRRPARGSGTTAASGREG